MKSTFTLLAPILTGLMFSCQATEGQQGGPGTTGGASPTVVTQDNFPQAYTNMRLGAILQKTGGVNSFFEMPVPSSIPEEQFVVRMNRDTHYSVAVIDMSSGDVYVTVPETDQYVSMACALASKPEAISQMRDSMRLRMEASTLCQGDVLAQNMEDAYQHMWHQWCHKTLSPVG